MSTSQSQTNPMLPLHSDRPASALDLANGLSLGAAAVRLGGDLLRLGRFREAESVLLRALATRDPRDRSTLLRATLYLAEGARTAGRVEDALGHYRQLLSHSTRYARWDHESLAHAGIGLCLLDRQLLDAAQDQWACARAIVGRREEWFEDREILEIFMARLQVLSGAVDFALQRLRFAAAALREQDLFRWAQVELERVLILAVTDPDAAHHLLLETAASVVGVDSPPLRERLVTVGRIVSEARGGTQGNPLATGPRAGDKPSVSTHPSQNVAAYECTSMNNL